MHWMPVICFVSHDIFIYKSIREYITDGFINIIEITNDMFSDDIFLYVVPSKNLFLTESVCKH
jgi:hypothetical protein